MNCILVPLEIIANDAIIGASAMAEKSTSTAPLK
jgi:hypothetical protein